MMNSAGSEGGIGGTKVQTVMILSDAMVALTFYSEANSISFFYFIPP